MAQSTNDVIPTAIRLAALAQLTPLVGALDRLSGALLAKGEAFDAIVKSGRTHVQDATPVRLGQEFAAYGHTVERNRDRITRAADDLRDLGIGGTAVGTGLNAEPEYPQRMVVHLQTISRIELREGLDRVQLMQSMGDATAFAISRRSFAVFPRSTAYDRRPPASGVGTAIDGIICPPARPSPSMIPVIVCLLTT